MTDLGTDVNWDRFATLYYGDKNLMLPKGVEAFTMKEKRKDKIQASRTYVEALTAGKDHNDWVIAQGQPVIIHSTENYTTESSESDYEDFKNGTKNYYLPVVYGSYSKDSEENLLKGTDTDEVITASGQHVYRMINGTNGVGFYKAKGTFTNKAHKAYLLTDYDANNPGGSNAPLFISLDPDDEETGIQALPEAEDFKAKNDIYNLSGQRLQKMQKGINIVGGKKVIK